MTLGIVHLGIKAKEYCQQYHKETWQRSFGMRKYATRDGIISHCGEIDENYLRPREEFIDLNEYKEPKQYAPYTWEGCVVKIADKISYLGRDIEDAITLGILDDHLEELHQIIVGGIVLYL